MTNLRRFVRSDRARFIYCAGMPLAAVPLSQAVMCERDVGIAMLKATPLLITWPVSLPLMLGGVAAYCCYSREARNNMREWWALRSRIHY